MDQVHLAMHVGLTAILAWFALYFDLHDDLFIVDADFHNMAMIASQRFWAILFLLTANIGFLGFVTRHRIVRLLSVLFTSTIHGAIAGCLMLGGNSPWPGTCTIIAAMSYFLAYKNIKDMFWPSAQPISR